jgi:hypothetical protein
MSAADRIAALDSLPAQELIARTDAALALFVEAMSTETTLLRAGRLRESAPVTAEKSRLAQDYVTLARSVQRQAQRLQIEAPAPLAQLRTGHERLATQMAENLRVIATARMVTEDVLSDAAAIAGRTGRTQTYSAPGASPQRSPEAARGIAVNRAL